MIRRNLKDLGHEVLVYDPALPESVGDVTTCITRSDRVVVATPPQFHYSYALQAVQHGRPFLVEKPLALDPVDSAVLLRLADLNRVSGAVGHIAFHAGYPRTPATSVVAFRAGNNPGYHDVSAWWDIGVHDVAVAVDKIGRPTNIRLDQDFDHYQARLESPLGTAEITGTRTSQTKEWKLVFDGWPWTPYDSPAEPLRTELEWWLDGGSNLDDGHLVVETLWRGDKCSS